MFKKTLMAGAAGAALFAVAAPVSTIAEAGNLKNGAPADLKIYGQVGRALLFYDDGDAADWRSVDADVASTRFGFNANAKLTESLTINAVFENEVESNTPNGVNQATDTDTGGGFTNRKAEISLKSKSFGRLTLGQTSTVSDGMSDGLTLDAAGAATVGMDVDLTTGGLTFKNDNAAAADTGVTIRNTFKTFDRGRQDGIQYETPNFNGLRLQVGADSAGGNMAFGGLYDGKFGGVKVRIRGFWEARNGVDQTYQIGGSVLHDSGISATLLYGVEEREVADQSSATLAAATTAAKDRQVLAARIGYTANMNSLGVTGIAALATFTDNQGAVGNNGQAFGVAVYQDVKKAGAGFFANVMLWDLDRLSGTSTVDVDEILTVFVGGKLKF